MRTKLFLFLGLLILLTSESAFSRPTIASVEELSTPELWQVGFRAAAVQEMICEGLGRREAERILTRRYHHRETRIEGQLGPKQNPEITLTLPPCSHFRGSNRRYAASIRELERRLFSSNN